jgi:hypothetical protein
LRRAENLLCYWTNQLRAPWQTPAWVADMRRAWPPWQFARLMENRWTSSETKFIAPELWNAYVDADLRPSLGDRSLRVWGGLDLSIRHDMTALVLCTYDDDSRRVVVVSHRVLVPQGSDIRFSMVEDTIRDAAARFDLASISYDPFQAESMAQRLRGEGINLLGFAQTQGNLTEAASNLFTLVRERNLISYPSDDLRTAVINCAVSESTRGFFRLANDRPGAKIDLAAALSFAALAAVREGARGTPRIIEYYRRLAEADADADDGAAPDEGVVESMEDQTSITPSLPALSVKAMAEPSPTKSTVMRRFITTAILIIICAATAIAQQELSHEFKKKAWKALDAIQRIDPIIDATRLDATQENLLVDADKAIDEAKYEATTPLDMKVLHALQMASIMKRSQAHQDSPLNPEFKQDFDRAVQCVDEVELQITPDVLSEEGKRMALKDACNKRTDEWGEGITR